MDEKSKACPGCGGELEIDFDFGDIIVIVCWQCGYSMPEDEVKKIIEKGNE